VILTDIMTAENRKTVILNDNIWQYYCFPVFLSNKCSVGEHTTSGKNDGITTLRMLFTKVCSFLIKKQTTDFFFSISCFMKHTSNKFIYIFYYWHVFFPDQIEGNSMESINVEENQSSLRHGLHHQAGSNFFK